MIDILSVPGPASEWPGRWALATEAQSGDLERAAKETAPFLQMSLDDARAFLLRHNIRVRVALPPPTIAEMLAAAREHYCPRRKERT